MMQVANVTVESCEATTPIGLRRSRLMIRAVWQRGVSHVDSAKHPLPLSSTSQRGQNSVIDLPRLQPLFGNECRRFKATSSPAVVGEENAFENGFLTGDFEPRTDLLGQSFWFPSTYDTDFFVFFYRSACMCATLLLCFFPLSVTP